MLKFFISSANLILFIFITQSILADSAVVINEILPTPSSGKDWIELYNSSQSDIDISGWILDDEGTSTDMLKIPDNTIIAKQSLKLFYVSNRLNKDGDIVSLKNDSGEVDKYEYSSSSTDVSFGRYPNGGSSWATCSPTPESVNSGCIIILEPIPSPTPTTSTSTTKSPSPSPKTSSPKVTSGSTAFKSPSPSPSKSTTILGEKSQISSSPPTSNTELLTSPSPSASSLPQKNETASKTKVASILLGSGVILIGTSIGLYLWYRKNQQIIQADKKEENF